MIYNAADGSVLAVTQEFLDDAGLPIIPRSGFPLVKLVDSDKVTLSAVVASPSSTAGSWKANISIPNMGLEEKLEFKLVWRLLDSAGNKYRETDVVLVEPKVDSRSSDVVAVFGDAVFSFTLPVHFGKGDIGSYQLYVNNEQVLPSEVDLHQVQPTRMIDKTTFIAPLNLRAPSLEAALLRVKVKHAGAVLEKTYIYKLWCVTPKILLAMSHLESFLNKSRIENIIPELRYTDGDLLTYLERGLYLFNTVGQTTHFTGTNMQGVLFEAWTTCSSYYALSAQLLAEGSLSFDFSGQGVSLSVDRTPQLDSALSRIESFISDKIVPMKAKMAVQGITSGDGSVGATTLRKSSNLGSVGIINAPTTSVPYGMPVFTGRRTF